MSILNDIETKKMIKDNKIIIDPYLKSFKDQIAIIVI